MINLIKEKVPLRIKNITKIFFKNICQSAIYFFHKKKNKRSRLRKIIFICKGNICRSAFAEFYLKTLKIDNELIIESCGLDVDQTNFSPPDAVQIAAELGINLNTNRSKNVSSLNIEKADLIVAMEFDHYKKLILSFPHIKDNIVLLRDFLPWPEFLQCNIADPYNEDLKEFRRCFKTMKRALDRLVLHVGRDI